MPGRLRGPQRHRPEPVPLEPHHPSRAVDRRLWLVLAGATLGLDWRWLVALAGIVTLLGL
ncbi:MAG: hypothetical protein U1F49_04700 [Rubrivivax sp.]